MEKKKRIKAPTMEDLIPDANRRNEVMRRLYNNDSLLGQGGIFTDMLQSMINAALEGEIDYTLGSVSETGLDNRRNGHINKQVRSSAGTLDIRTPRDREGVHEPVILKKWQRSLGTGIDEIILSLYARGQSVEDVRFQLVQLYGVELSAGAISAVTDKIIPEITDWQNRPLQPFYSIIYLDAIHYKVRQDGKVISKAFYTIYSVDAHGQRDILGLYLTDSEGSRQWGLILEDIKNRGVRDVLFFCIDGLTGFKDVIEQVFPESQVQRCIVHMIRNSVKFVSHKDVKAVCADLKLIYTSSNREQAAVALESFSIKWDKKYKEISPKWRSNWDELMAFMDYSANIRRLIYTTNPVEGVHRIIRKVTKTKGAWCNDMALLKQIYLTLTYNEKSWKINISNALNIKRELIDQFGERYLKHLT
jgi:transposase-like protein